MRLIIAIVAIAVTAGLASFAAAQDSTPTAIACASPVAGTPAAGTPLAADAVASPVSTPSDCDLPTEITVELVDIAFKPNEITIAANVPTTFIVQNSGLALHNFSLDALGISINLGPGGSETVVVTLPAGDYEYYCNIPGHVPAGMTGVLHVQ